MPILPMSLHDLQSRRTAGFPGLESASPDHGPLPPSSAEFVSLSSEMLQRLRDIKGTAPDGRKEP
jgi:hypothetical protein